MGVQLQNLRIFKGHSRDEAARRLGVASRHFEAIEEGAIKPEPAMLLEMAGIYDVPPSQIFTVSGATSPTGS